MKVNIFAIDPVPGGSRLNDHMWQNIKVTPNIGICSVILAQHDRRKLFSPYFPRVKGPFTDIDIMPGDHSTIVEDKGLKSEAYQMVSFLAKRFLTARGTVFKDKSLLTDVEVLENYAKIAENFDDYATFAKGAGKDSKKFKGERLIKDLDGKLLARMLPIKPAFFLNEHHRETFQKYFPRLSNEIDKPTSYAFREERWNEYKRELDMLAMQYPLTATMVIFFIYSCRANQKK